MSVNTARTLRLSATEKPSMGWNTGRVPDEDFISGTPNEPLSYASNSAIGRAQKSSLTQ
jgi:hypothetical protein